MDIAPHTACASTRPQDLCCFYGVPGFKCDGMGEDGTVDPNLVTLDADGFALVAFLRDTASMTTFVIRYLTEHLGGEVQDMAEVTKMSYWYWNIEPVFNPAQALENL